MAGGLEERDQKCVVADSRALVLEEAADRDLEETGELEYGVESRIMLAGLKVGDSDAVDADAVSQLLLRQVAPDTQLPDAITERHALSCKVISGRKVHHPSITNSGVVVYLLQGWNCRRGAEADG